MILISMRGFAEVSAAAPDRKLRVLRKYKQPKSGESTGRSNYYVAAISTIKRYHRSGGDQTIISSKVEELRNLAATERDGRRRAKLKSNARALESYLTHFGHRSLKLLPGKRLYFHHQDLVISAQPDLTVEEMGCLFS